MRIAQGLYERGFITYMRTDNVVISADALVDVRAEVQKVYGQQYLSPTPRTYASKVKNAQEAHEAIRPSTPMRSPRDLKSEFNPQEFSLYELIWQRTLASQMADAIGTTVSVRLGAISNGSDCEFAASGTTITFAGYRQVYEESTDDDTENNKREALLPKLAVGDTVDIASITPSGHFTQPPARYTEASLIKKLEELGIGRPSTWASIMQTIVNRGYVWKKGPGARAELGRVLRRQSAGEALSSALSITLSPRMPRKISMRSHRDCRTKNSGSKSSISAMTTAPSVSSEALQRTWTRSMPQRSTPSPSALIPQPALKSW